jgi:glycerol-3-phosphate acyltransferase PlsY
LSNVTAVALTAILLAYAIACVCAGYYLVRWRTGRDIRLTGSGGTGARNAGRLLGTGVFSLVLLLDVLKGAIAVAVARGLGLDGFGLGATVVAVVVGHVLPVQLGFRGGRGVAPSVGALLVYDATILLIPAAVFGVGYLIGGRRGVPSGLAAYAVAPIAAVAVHRAAADVAVLATVAVVILGAHHWHLREVFRRSAAVS